MKKRTIVTGALALALSLGVLAPQTSHAAEEDANLPEDINIVEGDGSELTFDILAAESEGAELGDEEGTIETIPEGAETDGTEETTNTDTGSDAVDETATGDDATDEGGEETTDETPATGDEELIDNETPAEDEGDAKDLDAQVLENNIAALEEKLANGNFTEESVSGVKEAIAKARDLIASGNYSEVEVATAVAELQIAGEGLVDAATGQPQPGVEPVLPSEGEEGNTNDDSNSGELKPEDLEGKEPGDYEEWVNNDYVDSNKDPATSEDDLKKDPNAVELKGNEKIDSENGGKIGVSGSSANKGVAKSGHVGFGVVKAQTGGGVGLSLASILAVASAAITGKRKK